MRPSTALYTGKDSCHRMQRKENVINKRVRRPFTKLIEADFVNFVLNLIPSSYETCFGSPVFSWISRPILRPANKAVKIQRRILRFRHNFREQWPRDPSIHIHQQQLAAGEDPYGEGIVRLYHSRLVERTNSDRKNRLYSGQV